jgi:thiosulfate dehydrogenase [quinone] large subunit
MTPGVSRLDNPHTGSGMFRDAVAAATGLAILRALSSYSWLSGALVGKDAKFSHDFLSGAGLASRITDPEKGFAVKALTEGVSHFLTNVVAPNAQIFAWLIALGELCVGVSLLLGIVTRLGGFFAIVQAITNILVAGGNGADTIGHNYMLALVGLVVILTAAARTYGIDGWLISRYPNARWLRFIC